MTLRPRIAFFPAWSKPLLCASAGLLGVSAIAVGSQSGAQGQVWQDNMPLDAVLARAKRESRGVLLGFCADWSVQSRELRARLLEDTRGSRLLQTRVIVLSFDLLRQPPEAARFHVKIAPTLILLSPDGDELERWVRVPDVNRLVRDIDSALGGETSLVLRRAKLKPGNVRARLDLDHELIEIGRYEAAFDELVWMLDGEFGEINNTPDHYGRDRERIGEGFKSVRYDAVIRVLASMRHAYPPAEAELQARLVRAREAVLTQPNHALATDSFGALASALGKSEELLDVFRTVPEGRARTILQSAAFAELVRQHAYSEAAELCEIEEIIHRIEHPVEIPGVVRGVAKMMMPSRASIAFRALRHFEVLRNAMFFEVYAGANRLTEARRVAEAVLRGPRLDGNLQADVRRHFGVTTAGTEPEFGAWPQDSAGLLLQLARRARPDGWEALLTELALPELLDARKRNLPKVAADLFRPSPLIATEEGAQAEVSATAQPEPAIAGEQDILWLEAFLVEAACPGVLPFLWSHVQGSPRLTIQLVPEMLVQQYPEYSAFDPGRWDAKPGEGVVAIAGREIVGLSMQELIALWREGEAGDDVSLIVQGAGQNESSFREVVVRRIGWVRYEGRDGQVIIESDPNRRRSTGSLDAR